MAFVRDVLTVLMKDEQGTYNIYTSLFDAVAQ